MSLFYTLSTLNYYNLVIFKSWKVVEKVVKTSIL